MPRDLATAQAALMREAEELRVRVPRPAGPARDLVEQDITRLEARIDALDGDA